MSETDDISIQLHLFPPLSPCGAVIVVSSPEYTIRFVSLSLNESEYAFVERFDAKLSTLFALQDEVQKAQKSETSGVK